MPLPDRVRELAQRLLLLVLIVMALEVVVAVALLGWRSLLPAHSSPWLVTALALATGALVLGAGGWARARLGAGPSPRLARGIAAIERLPLGSWMALCLILGLLLRLGWVTLYPAAPASDGAIYLGLAQRLANGEDYGGSGWRAYWPPGYPLLLTPLVALFGTGREMLIGLNLALFVATALTLSRLAGHLAGALAARLAPALIALWPTHIALSGLPEKEYPLILLVSLLCLLWLEQPARLARAWLAGLLLGLAALMQPSLLVLPLALLLGDLIEARPARQLGARLALLLLGMALVVGPWTLRNWLVLDAFVLISTNGGDNLYRANNPLATGGFMRRGEVDLSGLDELEANRRGAELALAWISEHPGDFLALALEKQMRFLGDDGTGVYASLRRGGLEVPEPVYRAWKGLANLAWLLLWLLILAAALKRWRAPPALWPSPTLLLGLFALYGLHSIFESNGKYHLPVLGLILALAAVLIAQDMAAKATRESPP
ncbi:MAG: DUF2029 domain-containing protein [Chromatiaceae bacterium]|nr:DUF2029 domain-containing protein [Chromatiaceae bacterium]